MIDVSGFGLSIVIVAIQTFPVGFEVKVFADDADPLTVGDDEVAGYIMQYDGTPFFYTKSTPIEVSLSTVPGSDDDINLKILLSARKVTSNLLPISDITTMVVTYGDGKKVIFSQGSILSGPPADSISGGRRKGNTYKFAFGAVGGAQSATQVAAQIGQGLLGLL